MKIHLFKGYKKLAIALSIIAVLVILLGILLGASFLSNKNGLTTGNYFQTLSNIDGIVEKNPKINELAFLGSHDSFSNEINSKSEIDPAENGFLANKALSKMIRGFTVRFAVAQEVGASEQLSLGVRYFDIRASLYKGEWWTKHGLLSGRLDESLKEILSFLNERDGEVLILDFQHIYVADESVENFMEHLASVKVDGKSLYDYASYSTSNDGIGINELTYNDVTNSGLESGIVMLFNCEDYDFKFDQISSHYLNKFYDREKDVRSLWHATANTKKLLSDIDKEANMLMSTSEHTGKLKINQTQHSFQTDGIFNVIFNWSLLNIADDYNASLVKNENFDKWLSAMPIFMVDFATSNKGEFNKIVNEKIFKYNLNLCR